MPAGQDPWQTLGLDKAGATKRDVKRAYSVLLKRHRPDSDPEGFRHLHAAYESILAALDEGYKVPLDPEMVIPGHEPTVPPALRDAFDALSQARIRNDRLAMEKAMDALSRACEDQPALRPDWGRLLTRIFPDGLSEAGVADTITPEDILAEAAAGSLLVAGQIIRHWARTNNIPALEKTGRRLTQPGARDLPAAGLLALNLAHVLAIWEPGGAAKLMDIAFRQLPAAQRETHLPMVENRLHLAALFWHLRDKWKPFWNSFLDRIESGESINWNRLEANEHLVALTRETPPDWPGWDLMHQVLSPDEWDKILVLSEVSPARNKSWYPAERADWSEKRDPPKLKPKPGGRPLILPGSKQAGKPVIPPRRQVSPGFHPLPSLEEQKMPPEHSRPVGPATVGANAAPKVACKPWPGSADIPGPLAKATLPRGNSREENAPPKHRRHRHRKSKSRLHLVWTIIAIVIIIRATIAVLNPPSQWTPAPQPSPPAFDLKQELEKFSPLPKPKREP